ncbi:MAG: hypothetical protein LIO54_03635 [Oscillospiraceae bacterium]|nr:hypothetical protein [Oscillospiraceae bacterium]
MIHIISGTARTSAGLKTKKSGGFSLPDAEEARLVRRGVAEYVTRPVTGAESSCVSVENENEQEPAEDAESDVRAAETGDAANLDALTLAELKALAEGAGLDAKGLRTKAELIAALTAAPTLAAAEPV